MIPAHLARHEELRDWLQQPHRAVQLTLGHELHTRPLAFGLERPRSVDRVGPLDDARVEVLCSMRMLSLP